MKFNYYHAPVGSVVNTIVSKVIDAPTTVCSVTILCVAAMQAILL